MNDDDLSRHIRQVIDTARSDEVYDVISPDIIETLLNYAYRGVPTGGFLYAVLSNDLRESIARADAHNSLILRPIVTFIYMQLPAPCWGSWEKVDAWLARFEATRKTLNASQDPS